MIEDNIFDNEISNLEVISYIKKHFNLNDSSTDIISTSTAFNVSRLKDDVSNIINLKLINNARFINKLFEAINSKIPISGLFFGCVETSTNRREMILKKYPVIVNHFIYFLDTIFKRVMPKLKITKKLYFYLTKGKNRVISKAETYGRLYSCGFELLDEKMINNIQYFVAKKIKQPFFDKSPTYGILIKLKRIGKNNKIFNVYKLRTMHPFAEYLQEYVYEKNNLDKGGKILDDFRISTEGRFFRKFWLDELPMIYNVLRGEMKLVGVRPLSVHYFSLYSNELQFERVKYKNGLFPPFYVDLPTTLDEIMASELKYLKLYKKSPFLTDIKYLFLSLKNIIFKRARSK